MEGLFARIEHRSDSQTDHWEVRSKDGLVSVYGTPGSIQLDPAVIANPENRRQVFAWKLTETRDPFGNLVRYDYDRDIGDTADHLWDQLYLRRIRYVNYSGPQDEETFLVSVTFNYEERPDPFSECRPGFEIRTTRRCTSVEIRTHADRDRLVRTYRLIYLDQRDVAIERLPLNAASLLGQVVVEGHDEERIESLPPLSFGYTSFDPAARRYQPLSGVAGSRPERSLGHRDYELVDLFGNGLPTVLELNGQVRYWRNRGNGQFDGLRTMETAPAGVQLSEPGVQLLDANGNGRADLMVIEGRRNGYYPLTFDGQWDEHGFVRYSNVPAIDFDAPDVRLLDLDGDGVTDALRTGSQFELYYNDAKDGWARADVRERVDSSEFPDVTFEDPRVRLGDMTGDGLQDVIFVHDGHVEYWPYRGYGRWGRRVSMRNAPRFEDAAFFPGIGFDPKRLLLGDVDGDGVADLVYVSSGRVTVWINQDGNAWSDPIVIHGTPPVTDATAVRLADMLGTGTDGILWTYDFGVFPDSAYKFLDLTGGIKPYVLDRMDNQMGAVTRVSYAPSTRFYVEDDERADTRWRTPLPFPVQVVSRVEVIDQISGGKLTTEFRYHHGYWDGTEREFRGFAMVEQFDTETFTDYHAPGAHGVDTRFEPVPEKHFSPPLLTKTWFHPGPVDVDATDWRELDWSADYWPGDPPALAHADGIDAFLDTLADPRDRRDALRALRGSKLRTELFALDGTPRQDRPFTVTEQAFGLREESPPARGEERRPRIFFPHPLAQRTTQWERGDEPMTQFGFSDTYDAFGQPGRQVSLAVPRHRDYRVAAPAGEPYLGTMTETRYAQRDDADRYIVDRVCATASFEIVNDGSQAVFDLYRRIQAGPLPPTLFAQSFNYYDGEAFVGLAFGELGDFGALVRTESLVLTEEMLRGALADPADPSAEAIPPYLRPGSPTAWTAEYPQEFRDTMPALAGYTFADGSDHRARGYFGQSSRVAFDFHLPALPRRGLPVTTRDPFGSDSTIAYDRPYHLLPVQATGAVGLSTSAEHDYRVLQCRIVTDINGNRRAVTFSPLGLVTSTAVMGKEGQIVGDTFEMPSSRVEYDFFAFANRRQPAFLRSVAREHHVNETDVAQPTREATIESVQYFDGFGRLLQTRTQAEDVLFGDAAYGGGVLPADQSAAVADTVGRRRSARDPLNVIVSGSQVYDNKGRVVERYEPFFSLGLDYQAPGEAQLGQKATMFFDPRGQVIRTVNPDGSEQRVIYGIPRDLRDPAQFAPSPWETYTYDRNDLAPLCKGPDGTSLATAAPRAHHFTPSSLVVDALGRAIQSVARNGLDPREWFVTRSDYDIRGNVLAVTDALGRATCRYLHDFANRAWRTEGADAGVRRRVLNVLGSETERRNSNAALVLLAYDRLQRPLRVWARDNGGGGLTLRQRMEYGDAGTPDQPTSIRAAMRERNLLGQLIRHHDEAGLMTIAAVDFKGTVLDKSRRAIADAPILAAFAQAPARAENVTTFQVDWDPKPLLTLDERENELLEATTYRITSTADALGRVKLVQLPLDIDGQRRELRPVYNKAGGLERVFLDGTLYVERVTYDAKGQRTLVAYGNGVMTRYAYDARTLLLRRLRSERYSKPDALTYRPSREVLQDVGYAYDLEGNILGIGDRAPGSGILNNPDALTATDATLAQLLASGNALNRRFEYDPVYRLISATGRECDRPPDGDPWQDRPRCIDLTKTRGYTERYVYDAVGNILRLEHRNQPGGFTREFTVEAGSNRLRRMQVGDDGYDYTFDADGNMQSEATARHFEWNHSDQMKAFSTRTAGAEPSVHVHYLYDAAGQRVKKLVRRQGGDVEATHYIDGVFEHHRWGSGAQAGANNHVHVMDDKQRIALARLGDAHPADTGPSVQFHLGDHLASSAVVCDATGAPTNREEFTPFGETSFGSFALKRYRFTGQERDEESGLTYHGARYYAPWLSRWTCTDPIGIRGGINLFAYVAGHPMQRCDPTGTEGTDPPAPNAVSDESADTLEFILHGEAGLRSTALTMDIDEPLPVGQRDITPAEARARALNVDNRQFLDLHTNRRTKFLGVGDPLTPAKPAISIEDNPLELITRRFSEIREMREIFDEAVGSIQNPERLTPTALKNRINSNIWDIIKSGTSTAATAVRNAFERIGFENVPNVGYAMRRGPRGGGPSADVAEEEALAASESAAEESLAPRSRLGPDPAFKIAFGAEAVLQIAIWARMIAEGRRKEAGIDAARKSPVGNSVVTALDVVAEVNKGRVGGAVSTYFQDQIPAVGIVMHPKEFIKQHVESSGFFMIWNLF